MAHEWRWADREDIWRRFRGVIGEVLVQDLVCGECGKHGNESRAMCRDCRTPIDREGFKLTLVTHGQNCDYREKVFHEGLYSLRLYSLSDFESDPHRTMSYAAQRLEQARALLVRK